MPAGKSYTGQTQAEIFCHGGRYVLRRILDEILAHEIRPAEPGEFTRRAFLSGRIDLARAEAVADLVASQTEYSYHSAKQQLLGNYSSYLETLRGNLIRILAEVEAGIDYPEEDIETETPGVAESLNKIISDFKELAGSYKSGRIIKDGFRIAIAGRPNAGKSSLFNLMLNQSRAIVTPTAGTTRDYLSEWIDLDGIAVEITDTAGLRVGQKVSRIEKIGQEAARAILKNADLIIWIVDLSRKSWPSELKTDLGKYREYGNIIIAYNKVDKIKKIPEKAGDEFDGKSRAFISCKTKAGYKDLRKSLILRIKSDMPDMTDRLMVTSARHEKKIKAALKSLRRAGKGFKENRSPELIAFELRQAVNAIDELVGKIYNEDILDEIFSRFCIGK
jgi:tRNA modification GTPase